MTKNFTLLLNLLITIILMSTAKSIDCQDSEYIVTYESGEQTCELCNDSFVSSDKKHCQSSCLEEIKPIQNKKTCLTLDTDCQTSYSKYQKKCFGERECKELGELVEGKSYYLCKDCPIDNYFQPKNQSCVKKCSNFQYVDKDTKQCIDLDECQQYQDHQNQACVDECVGRKNLVFKQLNFKFCGCLNNYLFNLEDNSCVQQCPKNTYKFNDICLISQSQCEEIISADGEECISECPKGQIPVPRNSFQQCECEHFFLKSTHQCVDDCSTGAQVKYGKMCLSNIDECPRFYDEKKNECQFWCDSNKISFEVPNKSYSKCVCRNSSFLSINEIDCLLRCEDSQITDIVRRKCLKNLFDCPGVISVDKQKCLSFCDQYQITVQENIENHFYLQCIQCSGENKFFQEKNGFKNCVNECSQGFVLNFQLLVCVPDKN